MDTNKWSEYSSELRMEVGKGRWVRFKLFWDMVIKRKSMHVSIQVFAPEDSDVILGNSALVRGV